MRESILEAVLRDYPTLFEVEGESNLFSAKYSRVS